MRRDWMGWKWMDRLSGPFLPLAPSLPRGRPHTLLLRSRVRHKPSFRGVRVLHPCKSATSPRKFTGFLRKRSNGAGLQTSGPGKSCVGLARRLGSRGASSCDGGGPQADTARTGRQGMRSPTKASRTRNQWIREKTGPTRDVPESLTDTIAKGRCAPGVGWRSGGGGEAGASEREAENGAEQIGRKCKAEKRMYIHRPSYTHVVHVIYPSEKYQSGPSHQSHGTAAAPTPPRTRWSPRPAASLKHYPEG